MGRNNKEHCISVLKIYDWISKPITLQLNNCFKSNTFLKDELSGNFDIVSGERTLIWEESDHLTVSGTVTISHESGNEPVNVYVNEQFAFSLLPGEKQSKSYNDIHSVEVSSNDVSNESTRSFGKYSLILENHFESINFIRRDCQLNCYLSDELGNPTDTIECNEIIQQKGRTSIEMTQPNGANVKLQNMKVRYKGFITITIVYEGNVYKLCTIPFHLTEKYILCAPEETFIDCKITDFDCLAYFNENSNQIAVSINFCPFIRVLAKKIIAVQANDCTPRSEKEIDLVSKLNVSNDRDFRYLDH